jgi:hypothetical protein
MHLKFAFAMAFWYFAMAKNNIAMARFFLHLPGELLFFKISKHSKTYPMTCSWFYCYVCVAFSNFLANLW